MSFEKFNELPKQKQYAIINAGLEIFGKYEYKKASTEEIARKAGISKGLLFYYFKNKKSFYFYLYDYCYELMKTMMKDEYYQKQTDFFVILEYASKKKIAMLKKYPYISEFSMRMFYSKEESITEELNEKLNVHIQKIYANYFVNVDYSKFKEGVQPEKVYKWLLWMSEGYLFEKQKKNEEINIDEIMETFKEFSTMMKQMCYKEEYL